MKKIVSLLLALVLVLGLTACGAEQPSAQQPSAESVPGGTTLPLYWPPLPEETQEQTQPVEQTQPDDRPTTPPTTEPSATEPTATEPLATETTATEPVATKPTEPKPTQPTQPVQTEPPATEPEETEPTQPPATEPVLGYLDPNGVYESKEDVALYIVLYGRLPGNFVTKKQAKAMGWSGNGNDPIPNNKCIGGDRFYNREGKLPSGYTYYECDIDTLGSSSRGRKRLVFTYSGLVYYTGNHYGSFTLLYGNP